MASLQSFFLLVSVTIVAFPRTTHTIQPNNAEQTRSIVPGAYIVEFSPSLTRLQPYNQNYHEIFYRKLTSIKTASKRTTSRTMNITPRQNFSSPLFIGTSFQLNNEEDVSAIAALDSVSAIWPVTTYSLAVTSIPRAVDLYELVSQTSNGTNKNLFGPHVMGGVDKLHAQGYTGEGVSIAIIDTGVDYRHPALGGGFGLGYKFQYGYDFVGDDYTGRNLPVPDSDPLDCNGHGTHVAGIIGANDPAFNGVAPNATLGMYRVFGCAGGTATDILIAAFSAAYQAGAQIISVSIGFDSGWMKDPAALVANRIVNAGVPCIIAASNSGRDGLFLPSTISNGIDVTSVGAVDSIDIPRFMYQGSFAVSSSLNTTFQYFSGNSPLPTKISGYQLYALSLNTTNPADACNDLPSNTPMLSEKIVLIHRDICPVETQMANVQKFGAEYIILYNDDDYISIPQSPYIVSLVMISAELGAEWVMYLKQGQTIEFNFPENVTATFIDTPNNVTGGTMSTFSSWSPTFELYIKPEVSAPGGNILSTYPLNLGGYAVESGTSMAAPYIAGVYALYKNAKGPTTDIDFKNFRSILATTATPLFFNDGKQTYPYLAPVIQQGGGLVNAFAAVHYKTVISPSVLALNDTAHFNRTMKFTISNPDSMAVSYTLTHQGAATAYTLIVNTTVPQRFPPDLSTQYATAIISPFALTIPSESTAVITVTFSLPMMLDTKRIPVYSGYINVQGSNNESFHLPYAGVGCEMKQVMVTHFNDVTPCVSNSSDDILLTKPIGNNETFNVTNYQPNFKWRMNFGSAFVRLDVLGSGNQTEVVGVNILGSVPLFPMYYVERNIFTIQSKVYSNATWNGTLSTGVLVPAGNYRLLYRALKIFGDRNKNSDYESWTSPVFGIVY